MQFQFWTQILVCIAFGLSLPGTDGFQAQDAITPQNDLSIFKDVKCNRADWKKLVEPFLLAQGAATRNPANLTLQNAYIASLDVINTWKATNLARMLELCNSFQFAECDENNKCVCGNGRAPYKFEEAPNGSSCLAKRGSICASEKDCADNLKCLNHYCDGMEAFLEESAKDGATAYKSIPSIVFTILGAMYFMQ